MGHSFAELELKADDSSLCESQDERDCEASKNLGHTSLDAVLQFFDALLGVFLDDIIDEMFPKEQRPELCYHGATEKGTQPMDIAHAFQMLVQNGMDNESKMVVAQQDMTLRDVLELEAGDVIPIELPSTFELKANKVPVYRCTMGVARGNLAVKIVDQIVRPK